MAKGDPREPDDTVHLKLRLPESLRAQLADAAWNAGGRSMNAEILWRLTQTFEPQIADAIQKLRIEKRNEFLAQRGTNFEKYLEAQLDMIMGSPDQMAYMEQRLAKQKAAQERRKAAKKSGATTLPPTSK
jgi:hypothetical protein